jgi:SpoVK/Ycf46/Vps4 family AAA+-type ATPase
MSAVSANCLPRAYAPLVRLWVLRLIHLGGGVLGDRRQRADLGPEALAAAGLKPCRPWQVKEDKELAAQVEAAYLQALKTAEAKSLGFPAGTSLARNILWLGEAAGLTPTDQAILHFVAVSCHHPGLENALEQLGALSLGALQSVLSRVLELPLKAVAKALDSTGQLARTGLLQVDGTRNYTFMGKLEVLNGLGDQLTLRCAAPAGLFRGAFVPGARPGLELGHFPHLAESLAILRPYLDSALRNRTKGVNVLIHGRPGTGKTELVRALAKDLGAALHEVAAQRSNGDPVEGNDRFHGYCLAQAVVGRHARQMIFFDEIEDVFRPREDNRSSGRNNVSGVKAWVNKILEENPAPAFWVTNHLHILDEAFVRRFDLVVHLDIPPRHVRRRMLEDQLGGLPLESGQKDLMAEHEGLSPALIAKAARVVGVVSRSQPQADLGKVLSQVLGSTLEALGYERNPRRGQELATSYRPELVHTDVDLAPLLQSLREHGSGRICFYGPPGTGKTAYGNYLARELGRPLMVRRASDLLNMYVGGTEKNLARMFQEARQDGAVLLLDEADSFLQARGRAERSWEVTQVNEMLTQMEDFPGIFIASTNLMDRLDEAALRRFDLKVRFGFLQPEQAWIMFQDAASALGIPVDPGLRANLGALAGLTPGDFATVVRQARLNRPKDAGAVLARLEAECRLKPGHGRQPIGFAGWGHRSDSGLPPEPAQDAVAQIWPRHPRPRNESSSRTGGRRLPGTSGPADLRPNAAQALPHRKDYCKN